MARIDDLACYGITPAPRSARVPARLSPWAAMRAECPGARLVRFIDVELGTQEFKAIRPGENFIDGMTIAYPDQPGRTADEWAALIARFDDLWHVEQEGTQCTMT